AALHARSDALLPVRHDPLDGVLEALGERNLLAREARVAPVARRIAFVATLERGRADVVAASPDEHLLLAELRRRLRLVEPLQRAVVTLVEAPILLDGKPEAIHLPQHEIERADRALEDRGIGEVEVEA